jgi:hypothetical protein
MSAKTANTTLTFQARGTGGIDFGTTPIKLGNAAGYTNATGDIWYRNSNGQLQPLPIGASGTVVGVSGGLPAYVAAGASGMVGGSVSGGYVTRSGNNLLFAPALSNRFFTYESTNVWTENTIPDAGVTTPCTGLTSNTAYFLYAYVSSGTVTLDLSTTGTASQNGILVKSGATNRLLIALCNTESAGAVITHNESADTQDLNNVFNKRPVIIFKGDSTSVWTVASATFANANGKGTNSVTATCDGNLPIDCEVRINADATTVNFSVVGIGLDSSTVNSSSLNPAGWSNTSSVAAVSMAQYMGTPSQALHNFRWIEARSSSGTASFFGGGGTPSQIAGIRLKGWF